MIRELQIWGREKSPAAWDMLCLRQLQLVLVEATRQEPRLPGTCSQLCHKLLCNFHPVILVFSVVCCGTVHKGRGWAGAMATFTQQLLQLHLWIGNLPRLPQGEKMWLFLPFIVPCFSSGTWVLANSRHAELLQVFGVMLVLPSSSGC